MLCKAACDVQALVTAAVLAFPAPWRKKLIGVLFGLGTVVAANLARIATLYFVGAFSRNVVTAPRVADGHELR